MGEQVAAGFLKKQSFLRWPGEIVEETISRILQEIAGWSEK